MTAPCADCGIDTMPCTRKRGCRHGGKWEYYLVENAVWDAAGSPDGFLCIGCLEARLGRELKERDFPSYGINLWSPWDTPRLGARKGQDRRDIWRNLSE